MTELLLEFTVFVILLGVGLSLIVTFISIYCFVLLPLVGIPWLIFVAPQWAWYCQSRVISVSDAVYLTNTRSWQSFSEIFDKVYINYNGKIISCNGLVSFKTVSNTLCHFVHDLEILEYKTEPAIKRNGESYVKSFYRLKADSGYHVSTKIPSYEINYENPSLA
jgi:hypothetical protein